MTYNLYQKDSQMVKKFVKVLVGGLEKRIYPKDISKVHRKKVKKLPRIP